MKQHSSSSSSSVETLTDTCDFLVEPFHSHVTAASPPIGELQQRQPEHPERARVFAKSRACSCYFLPDVNAARMRPPTLLIKWSLAAIIFTAHSRLQHIALDPIGLRALDMYKLCESKIIPCLG